MKNNTNKGITLIALVITIIVLLILVGVTITMLTGENGILNQSQKATIETYHGTVKDQVILGVNQYHVDKNTTGVSEDVVAYLVSKGYAKQVTGQEYYRVSVETVAKNIKTGKGATKDDGDIYVIEEYKSSSANSVRIASTSKADVQSNIKVADESAGGTKQYVLRYYDKSGNTKDLLYLSGNGSYVDPNPGTNPGEDDDSEEDDEPKIPNYPTAKEIKYVEDLIDVAMDVNQKKENYENKKIVLTKDLDFANKSDYRDPEHYYSYNNNKTEYYSLDTLNQVTTSGGTTVDDADTTNDSYPPTACVYDELQAAGSFPAPGFYQIGNTESTSFKGVFDGQGYTISNIYMSSNETYVSSNATTRESTGIFGYNDGYINNLKISNINIALYGQLPVGVLTSNNNNVIKNCSVDATMSFESAPPSDFSVLSINNKGNIYGCTVDGTYKINVAPNNFGVISIINEENAKITSCVINGTYKIANAYYPNFGVAAYSNSGSIKSCEIGGEYTLGSGPKSSYDFGILTTKNTETGLLTSNVVKATIGGLNGVQNFGAVTSENLGKVKNCSVDSTTSYAFNSQINIYGGVVGVNDGIIDHCENYFSNKNLNVSKCAGGIVGQNNKTISNCTNYGEFEVIGTQMGGIIGKNNSTEVIENCNNGQEGSEDLIINSSSLEAGGIIGQTEATTELKVKNCNNYMKINGNSSAGIVMQTGLVKSVNIINCNNYGDIKATNSATGIISTYKVNTKEAETTFNVSDCTNNGTINGGSAICGGIVSDLMCYSEVTISNCINNGSVSQEQRYAGGIAGRIFSTSGDKNTIISNCQNNGDVSGGHEAGGILGEASGPIRIENCKNTGKINEKISSNGIGGIVGYCKSTVTISGCENTGAVNGYWGVGGILGWPCASFDVQNSKNSGNIKCSYEDAAGIVGYTNSGSENTGKVFGCINTGEISNGARLAGIVGVNNIDSNLTIQNCINEGNITGSTDDISGICGYMKGAKIYNCGNKGTISGPHAAGIGGHFENGEIINCFNTGSIAGTTSDFGGGIAGFGISGLIKNCYNASTDITNGGGIISCGGNSFKLENVYNISGINAMVTNYTGMPLTQTVTTMEEADMKAESFVTTLNNNKENYSSWKQDTSTTNKGYPIFE